MQYIALAIYIGSGILQFFAAMFGTQAYFELNGFEGWLISVLAGLMVAWTPIVGAVAGILGAVIAWNWPVWLAVVVFVLPLVACVALLVIALFRDQLRRSG